MSLYKLLWLHRAPLQKRSHCTAKEAGEDFPAGPCGIPASTWTVCSTSHSTSTHVAERGGHDDTTELMVRVLNSTLEHYAVIMFSSRSCGYAADS